MKTTDVGLIHKFSSTGTYVKWDSQDKESKKRQPNCFGCDSPKVLKEEGITQEEILTDREDITDNGVPKRLEG